MAFTGIYIHAVWSTHLREPTLDNRAMSLMRYHIKKFAERRKIGLIVVNGYRDHLHILVRLRPSESISQVIHLIKGESSYWYNNIHLESGNFRWQTSYWARSVTPDELRAVIEYIIRQEDHHRQQTFGEEWVELRSKTKDPLGRLIP